MNALPAEQTNQDVNAMPASMGSMKLEMTGQFLHEARHKHALFFAGEGDVPRSFTVLAALAYKPLNEDEVDLTRNGIVVIDNDNWRIVADEISGQSTGLMGASPEQIEVLSHIVTMDWADFASFCRTQSRYRAGSPDIDMSAIVPAGGSHGNQTRLGLRNPKMDDYRNDFIRSLNDLGEFNLPATSRDGMIRDLMMRSSVTTPEGRMLSWSVSMDFNWDRSGNVNRGADLDPAYDARWAKALRNDPTIMERATEAAFAPYLVPDYAVFDLEEEANCQLVSSEGDDILLSSYRGKDMSFTDFHDLRKKLSALEGDDLVYLWTTARVLDKEFNRLNRSSDVMPHLNAIRADMEQEWSMELEDEVSFSM
ncbi:hypothetical protein [Paracoccus sp. ME4]|uniref:hypothetical protein n=1 Tax=Paracoccus sp. ME4 TaxID=3138066 RepID=UPI00398AF5E0